MSLAVAFSIHESTANPLAGVKQILLTLIWNHFSYAMKTSKLRFSSFLKAHRVHAHAYIGLDAQPPVTVSGNQINNQQLHHILRI